MIRLHFVVEGQTEEVFVRDVLSIDLANHSIIAAGHPITTSRSQGKLHRGGSVKYFHLRKDLTLWMKQDQNPDARFTTMIDLYRIPTDFPGFEESKPINDPHSRARFLEEKLAADINDWRFIPYIQVHEFEALLFSDPSAFRIAFPEAVAAIEELTKVAQSVVSPEHIDSEQPPSQRIVALLPAFAKTVHGPTVAAHIGLANLRNKCSHFDAWMDTLIRTVHL